MASDIVWQQIKTEYITQGESPRSLAKKYRVGKDKIYQKVKEENWEGQRGQFKDDTGTKIRDSIQEQMIDDAVKLMHATDGLLDRVNELIDLGNPKHMTPAGLKNISETILNIKVIKNIRSEEDIEEQKARIAKLQKDAQDEDKNKTITITLEGDLSRYAQ